MMPKSDIIDVLNVVGLPDMRQYAESDLSVSEKNVSGKTNLVNDLGPLALWWNLWK